MSEKINQRPEKTKWESFIEYHSQPRLTKPRRHEISFFRRAWNRSQYIGDFRSQINPYGFEVVRRGNEGPYYIAANNGEYFHVTDIGISAQEAAGKIGKYHIGFDHVRAEALKQGNYLKHDMLPGFKNSFEQLAQAQHDHRFWMHGEQSQCRTDKKREVADMIQECWKEMEHSRRFFSRKPDGSTFVRNLEEKGFHLARDERQGFVVVHESGQVLGLRYCLKMKSHILKECLGPVMAQPTAEEVIKNLRSESLTARVKNRVLTMANVRKGKGLGM